MCVCVLCCVVCVCVCVGVWVCVCVVCVCVCGVVCACVLCVCACWEGVWGGAFVCLLVAALFDWILHHNLQPLSLMQIAALLALSVGITFFSVVGDLIESMLKRNCGVKDSGTMLPGHGGVLDRVDGLVVATPLFVLTVMLVLDSEYQVSL